MSNVTSRPLESAPRRRTPAVVSAGRVITLMFWMLRFFAVLLILGSTFGNYVQFVGGWNVAWPVSWTAIGFAVFYQLVCSVLQWGFKAVRWWPLYGLALIASAIPSFLTYNAWAGSYLTAQFGTALAFVIMGLAVIAADALPEWVLVG